MHGGGEPRVRCDERDSGTPPLPLGLARICRVVMRSMVCLSSRSSHIEERRRTSAMGGLGPAAASDAFAASFSPLVSTHTRYRRTRLNAAGVGGRAAFTIDDDERGGSGGGDGGALHGGYSPPAVEMPAGGPNGRGAGGAASKYAPVAADDAAEDEHGVSGLHL